MAETSVFGDADYTKWAEALWAQQHNGAEAKFGVDFGLEEIYAMIESTMDSTLKEQVEEAEKFWSETLADNQDYKKLENRLRSSINNLFDLYASDVEELPNYLEDERQKKIAEIRAGVDMTPDEELWDRVTEAEEAIRDLNAQYEHRYDTMTEGERVISARMEEAYKSGNIEEFNRLADILNQGRSEMAGEQISYMEDLTEKAVAAANSAERDATVQATLDSMRQSREALDEAFANGFKTQLDDIAKASIDEKGNFDMKSYRKALDVIKENNELLYNTLMKSVPQLDDILSGEMTEEEAASMFSSEDARRQLSEAAKTVYEGWQKQVENFESEIMSRNGDHNAVLKFIADQFDILKDPAVIGDLVASVSGSAKDVLDAAFKAAGMEDISPAFEGTGGKSFILSYVSGTVEQLGRYMDTLANGKVTPTKLAEGFNALKKAMLVEDGSGRQNILDFWNGLDTTKQNKFTSNTGLTAEWFEKLAKGEKLSADELRALNDELLRAEFVSKSGSWKVLSDAVKEMGTNATDTMGKVSGVMDEMDKLGQARAGLKWLIGEGKSAPRETVEAVRTMVAGVLGVAEDMLKDDDTLNIMDAFFSERHMKQMQDGIQSYYKMFLDMTKDMGVNIDFRNNESVIAGLQQLKETAGQGIIADMADSFILMLNKGLIELGPEMATVLEQSLNFEKIKAGVFDKINNTKTEYGKILGLDTLLTEASQSEEALIALAEQWNNTDSSVKATLRSLDGVPKEVWNILDRGPANIDSDAFKAFGKAISDVDPSKLITTNTELEKLRKTLDEMSKGGSYKAQGLSNIQKDLDETKQAVAAYHFLYDDPLGQYGRGNIDLHNRQPAYNPDGSISTVESFSFWDDNVGKEVLLPSVLNGKHVSQNEAIDEYYRTGQHLGMFDTWQEADAYAEMLHEEQAKMYAMVEERKAAQKAMMDWLGVSETMFDTEEGRKQVQAEAERKIREDTEVYKNMYDEIMKNVTDKRKELEERLGEGFDWEAFDKADELEKIKMLTAEDTAWVGDLVPNLYSFADAINYLSETGDISGLILNLDKITSGDLNLAKLGFGTFDIIDKMKSDVKAAKS